jgi:hypothetical protein
VIKVNTAGKMRKMTDGEKKEKICGIGKHDMLQVQ